MGERHCVWRGSAINKITEDVRADGRLVECTGFTRPDATARCVVANRRGVGDTVKVDIPAFWYYRRECVRIYADCCYTVRGSSLDLLTFWLAGEVVNLTKPLPNDYQTLTKTLPEPHQVRVRLGSPSPSKVR